MLVNYTYVGKIGHRSKRFDELDHSSLIGIGQRAAHRAGIVLHVAGIAGPPGSPRLHADRRNRGRDVGTVEAALAGGLETARTILAADATP
jgi:hypothetical protein